MEKVDTGESCQLSPKKDSLRRAFTNIFPGKISGLTIPSARFAIFFTILAWLLFVAQHLANLWHEPELSLSSISDFTLYFLTISMLTGSCLAYLVSRLGNYERVNAHTPVPRSTLEKYFAREQPKLAVLVPSYREDERVNRYTLLSAGLQEYPNLRVTLLIDDPPNASDPQHLAMLNRTRQLVTELNDLLLEPARKFTTALEKFELEQVRGDDVARSSLSVLAGHYDDAVFWFEREAEAIDQVDHVDDFFAVDLLARMALDLAKTASALRAAAEAPDARLSTDRMVQLYSRLINIFSTEFFSFERKRFASLSHEANKAMNLNSYIGLMGGSYLDVASARGRILIPAKDQQADLVIPDSDYLLTLDADSILLPEYCMRLVYLMQQPENARVAVSQAPYSSFPNSTSPLERIAGATTDLQHIVHQGLEKHNAAFWVGANAVIRKSALMELEEKDQVDGSLIRRFINDRTVIEDTESSINLRAMGWKIYNYPERLSYSATPPDFGSLAVQRQRWANGGLIIFPLLMAQLRKSADASRKRISLTEVALRATYLASIAWCSLCLCILFFYPFANGMFSTLAVFTALPYFICMTLDLAWLGYRRSDIFKVYGLNLLLLPINIVGTIQSIGQIIGGHKISFARTPKVQNRSVAPLLYLVIPLILIVWSIWTLRTDFIELDRSHFALTLVNLSVLIFACASFIGGRFFISDIYLNLREFVYVHATADASLGSRDDAGTDWSTILYAEAEPRDQANVTDIEDARVVPKRVHGEIEIRLPAQLTSYENANNGG